MQKSVIIIGGSKHIGRNLVLSLAKEKWNILFTYSNNTNEAKATFEEANKYNQNIKMLKFNSAEILTSEGKKKFRKAWGSTKFNNLCGLVYNVGNLGDTKKIIDIDIKNFKKLFDINFFPIVEFVKFSYQFMKNSSYGSIVTISSTIAKFGSSQKTPYCSTKGAINSFTLALSKELGSENIRVNCISPGIIEKSDQKIDINTIKTIPLGRLGTTNDVSELITFLLSEKSSFINGINIPVNGGR